MDTHKYIHIAMFASIATYTIYIYVERVSENEEEYKYRRELSMFYNTDSIFPS